MQRVAFYFTNPNNFLREVTFLAGRVVQSPSLAGTVLVTLDLTNDADVATARAAAARLGGVEMGLAEEKLRELVAADPDLQDTLTDLPAVR